MNASKSSAQTTRIWTLVVAGAALVAAGLSAIFVIVLSVFARYMYVEDLGLGLDENTMFLVTRISPADRGIVIFGGALIVAGAAALIASALRRRYRDRAH